MITCTRRLEWDAAHRVLRHESKCATLHGHRYAAEVTCAALELDEVGRVVDFGVIKELLGAWIDRFWDHTTLVNREDTALLEFCNAQFLHGTNQPPYVFAGEPTAELIAAELLERGARTFRQNNSGIWVSRVRVYETPNCYAEAVVG